MDANFNIGQFSSFSWHTQSLSTSFVGCKTFMHRHEFSFLWSIFSSLVHFKNGPKYLTRGTAQVFIPLMWFLLYSLVSSIFIRSLEINFFFNFHLFDAIHSQYPNVLVSFLFSERSDFVLIWLFNSFRDLSFSTFHYLHGTFINAKFHPYIVTLYPHCLYLGFQFFFHFLANCLMSSIYIKWLIFF